MRDHSGPILRPRKNSRTKALVWDLQTTYWTAPLPPRRSLLYVVLNRLTNPGYLDAVKTVYAAGPTACHDLTIPLPPVRQLASSLLAVDPSFLQDDRQRQEYSDLLRKLQSVFFLAPRKVVRTGGVEALLRSNNVHNTIYQSGKSPEARAWLDAVPKTEAFNMYYVPNRIPDGLSEQVTYPASAVIGLCNLLL